MVTLATFSLHYHILKEVVAMRPITFVSPGETVFVKRINGKDETRRHLNELGLVEGDSITVIQNNNGNMILQVKSGRIALDQKLAMRIQC